MFVEAHNCEHRSPGSGSSNARAICRRLSTSAQAIQIGCSRPFQVEERSIVPSFDLLTLISCSSCMVDLRSGQVQLFALACRVDLMRPVSMFGCNFAAEQPAAMQLYPLCVKPGYWCRRYARMLLATNLYLVLPRCPVPCCSSSCTRQQSSLSCILIPEYYRPS